MDKVIKSPADHAQAVQRLDELLARDPASGTTECEELKLLADLIDAYEREHYNLGSGSEISWK